ncbi:hypothetical protein ACI65C_011457 [Semiaphis heraclei]
MPKNVYKPSCSLSKESQRKKRLVKNLIDINNDLDINSVHRVEKSITVNSREIAPECSLDFSNNDQSRMSLNTNLQESFLLKQSCIIDVTQTINEPISDSFPIFNFNQNINITDANDFQNVLASFIVSSRLPRNSATKLLKLLKSVDNLECLKLLPMDSRTLLSTPRSGHVEINNIGGGQYIHFGILSGLKYLLNTIAIQSLSELELWFNFDGLPINKGTGPAPLVQLYNRIKEEHACLPPQHPTNHYPFLDGQHVNGPLPFDDLYNEPYSQYSTLIMKDYTIRVSNEKRRRQTYIIVTSEDNHFAIPKIWFLVQNSLSVGNHCEWYWPTENALYKSEQYCNIENHWIKKTGFVFSITDSFKEGNFIIITEKLKQKKFVIVEFLNEESAEVVSTNWITVNDTLKTFYCQWPGNSYTEAKNKLTLFCENSTTEVESSTNQSQRKRIPKRHFDLSDADHNINSPSTQHIKKTKQQPSKKVFDRQRGQSNIEHLESDNSDNSHESEPFLQPSKKFSTLNNYPNSKGLFDICDSDSEQVVNNYDVIADLGKACSNDNLFNICESDSEQVVKNYNVIADLDKECSNDNLFETEIRGLLDTNLSQEMEQYSMADLMNKLNYIGHVVKDVSIKNIVIERELKILQLDVVKNQELLIALTEKATSAVTVSNTTPVNRINLKIPIQSLDDLNAIDADEEKMGALAKILQRNSKSFDTRRTTYLAMKIAIHNRFAETLNMEGRRGEKLAFGKYKVCTTIIVGYDAEINAMAPELKNNYKNRSTTTTSAIAPNKADHTQTINQQQIPECSKDADSIKASRVAEYQLLRMYLKCLHADIFKCTSVKWYFITIPEANLLNEINVKQVDFMYGKESFVAGQDIIVRLEDVIGFLMFVKTSYNLMSKQNDGNEKKSGFIEIGSGSIVPYCINNNQMYVPIFFFEGDVENLLQQSILISGWELAHFKFCCLVMGINKELFSNDSYRMTNIINVKDFYPPGIEIQEYFPDKRIYSDFIHQHDTFMHTNLPNSWLKEPPQIQFDESSTNLSTLRESVILHSTALIINNNMTTLCPTEICNLTRIPDRTCGEINRLAYKMQKATLEGKTFHCINQNPYIYSDMMITINELVNLILCSTTVARCTLILSNRLKVMLYLGNSEQITILKENNCIKSLKPEDTPLVKFQEIIKVLPQLKNILYEPNIS